MCAIADVDGFNSIYSTVISLSVRGEQQPSIMFILVISCALKYITIPYHYGAKVLLVL